MPRQPGIWLRKQDGFFYTTVRKKKIRLARDKAEARKALHGLLAGDEPPPDPPRLSFRKLADLFLGFCERTMAENPFLPRRCVLRGFCDHLGRRAVADLRVEH